MFIRRYQGEIQKNKFNGKGTFVFKDGRKYEGSWLDNMFHGYGIFTWPDGRQYEGYVLNSVNIQLLVCEGFEGGVWRTHLC